MMGLSKEDGWLISKTKSMVLSLSSMIFGSSSPSPSTMHIHPHSHKHDVQASAAAGLKTLTTFTHSNPLIIHSSTLTPPSHNFKSLFLRSLISTHSSSCSPCSSGMDDMLGTESGVYMMSSSSNQLMTTTMPAAPNDNEDRMVKRSMAAAAEEEEVVVYQYPPAIPLLDMPWTLTRHYSNGRLVLKQERVKHHEYFEAFRENGRLVLHLVSLDNVDDDDDQEITHDDEEADDFDDDDDDDEEYSSAFSVPRLIWHGNEVYGDDHQGKCLMFSNNVNNGGDEEEGNSTTLTTFCYPITTTTTTPAACDNNIVACLVK